MTPPLPLSMEQLVVAPVLLPLASAALMLCINERHRAARAFIDLVSCLLGLALSVALLLWVDARDAPASFAVYLPGNWPVPFGIVLVLDRLSALMLVLAAGLGLAALLFSLARWSRAGVHFHPLFQLQLMGLNGAFLTADLFNLFVFFEVLLAASYGLLLHGNGGMRVRAGLHYIAINLLASFLFLIGVAVLYGVSGTLNMADIAHKLPQVPAGDRGLLHAGAAILAVALLAKAAAWPLNFWLPPAYAAASAPVSALFALLTKVGVYAVLRLWTLCFPASAGASALFGADTLLWGGLATLGFGALGMMASQQLGRLTGFSIIASSGTVLAAIGFGQAALTGGARLPRPRLPAVHARRRRAAAAVGLRRQGGDAVGAARRRRCGRADLAAGRVDAVRSAHRLGLSGRDRAHAHRHPPLLGTAGPPGAAPARHRMPADRPAARRLHAARGAWRRGAALHARHRRRAAAAGALHRRGAVGTPAAGSACRGTAMSPARPPEGVDSLSEGPAEGPGVHR